jgi:hypothetical protein
MVIGFSFLDPAPVAELMAEEPGQANTKLSQVGDSGELVGTSLLNQYLNDIVGRGSRPRRRGEVVLGSTAAYKGTSLNITLHEPNNVMEIAYIIQQSDTSKTNC